MSKKHKKHRKKQSAFRSFTRFVVLLAAVIVIGFAAREFVVTPVSIAGDSMADTYNAGDIVLATRFDYLFSAPQRGDVALCRVDGRDGMYVKRVVALPGDRVEIVDGAVSINGQPQQEAYVSHPSDETMSILLGADQYMVLGDNRAVSYDSREADMGMLSRSDFIGKVRTRLWPLF